MDFYLNNTLINPPKNWREIAVQLNFQDGEFKSSELVINEWDFVRENIDALELWVTNGFIFEGMPFKISEQNTTVFDGYIDLTDGAIFDEYELKAKSKPRYSIDWLNDVAAGFSFEYLASIGTITNADYIDIPYIISSIPDYDKSLIALISLTFVGQTLYANGQALIATISALVSDPISYGELFRLILQIITFAALILAMLKLIKQIFELLIQRVKYHKGISARKLFEIGCTHLGLNFASTVIPNDYYILPKKYVVPKNPTSEHGVLGAFYPNEFPQIGFPDGTFADFIINMKDVFNGKVLFTGNTLNFERKDYNITAPSYIIPNVINTRYAFNTDEIKSNLLISFQTDVSESNTITQYLGAGYQIQLSPINVINQGYVLMKGLSNVDIPYALGKRKTELTTVEEIFDTLLEGIDFFVTPVINALNAIISTINDIIDFINDFTGWVSAFLSFDFPEIPAIGTITYTPLGSLIDNRIGMLLLENDYFTVDKLLGLTSDGKLNEVQPSAKILYANYYFINYNQYKLKNYPTLPFTFQNYLELANNANCINTQGIVCKVESVKFNIWNEIAEISTKEPYIYTNNFNINASEPTGE